MEPSPNQLFTPALFISLYTGSWQDEGAAVITFMVPSQICKSKQGESVIEGVTQQQQGALCTGWPEHLFILGENEWLIQTLYARFELFVSHIPLICTKSQYLTLWCLIDLPPCTELSHLLLFHTWEKITAILNAVIFDFLEVPEDQMQIKCFDAALLFHREEKHPYKCTWWTRLVILLIYWAKNQPKTNNIKYAWPDFEK